jgi:TolB protein
MSQLSSNIALALWVNHYPRLDDFSQHTNLEQHELPILANGISDSAPSPDGKSIAIVSKGWI